MQIYRITAGMVMKNGVAVEMHQDAELSIQAFDGAVDDDAWFTVNQNVLVVPRGRVTLLTLGPDGRQVVGSEQV